MISSHPIITAGTFEPLTILKIRHTTGYTRGYNTAGTFGPNGVKPRPATQKVSSKKKPQRGGTLVAPGVSPG